MTNRYLYISARTFPALSGTFGIPARLALNPKMPKEPSSPSLSSAQTERQCVKNETNRLENNNGQRTTHNIKQLEFSGLRAFGSRINFFQRWIRTRSENPTISYCQPLGTI